MVVAGGRLATRWTPGQLDREAYIRVERLLVAEAGGVATEVVIGDPTLYPPGTTGHVYTALNVLGFVEWKSGTYRPLVKHDGGPSDASTWYSTNNFTIGVANNPQGVRPVLSPTWGAIPPAAGKEYVVIMTGDTGRIQRVQATAWEGVNNKWEVMDPLLPDKQLRIKRTAA